MNISYDRPLRAAWDRMKLVLFRKPFAIEMWFVMGLSAWLANLFTSSSSGLHRTVDKGDMREVASAGTAWLAQPGVLFALSMGLLVLVALSLALSYVSARAQFVFLDNVIHGRAEFVAPWKRFGRLGKSLFQWNVAMSFAWLVPVAFAVVPLLPFAAALFAGEPFTDFLLPGVIAGFALAILATLALCVVYALAENFVVPLMWKHDEGAIAAWRRFGALLGRHPGDFGAFLVFLLFMTLAAVLAVVLAGLMTCCIGLALAVLPYFGTVLLLPMHFVFRALGPEFLRQYGAEWDVWEAAAPEASEGTA